MRLVAIGHAFLSGFASPAAEGMRIAHISYTQLCMDVKVSGIAIFRISRLLIHLTESGSMRSPRNLRAEANALTVQHRVDLGIKRLKCRCGANWPCLEWRRAEEMLREAQRLEVLRSSE